MRLRDYISLHITPEDQMWFRVQSLANEHDMGMALHSQLVKEIGSRPPANVSKDKKLLVKSCQRRMQWLRDEAMRLCPR